MARRAILPHDQVRPESPLRIPPPARREQDRIAAGLHDTAKKLGAGTEHHQRIEANLCLALDLAQSCGTAYATAPDRIKKLFNQAFFVRILVNPDASVRPELAPPFNHLLGPGAVATLRQTKRPVPKNGPIARGSQVEKASKGVPLVHGLTKRVLVELRGIEPLTFSLRTRRATNCATAPSPLAERRSDYHFAAAAQERNRPQRRRRPAGHRRPTTASWRPECRPRTPASRRRESCRPSRHRRNQAPAG